VAQQAREHAERSQQIGAAHDVGDGFGEDRMNCPDRGQRQGEALFQPGLLKHEQAQQVDQRDIDGVQRRQTSRLTWETGLSTAALAGATRGLSFFIGS
jgi:hypothetical protein